MELTLSDWLLLDQSDPLLLRKEVLYSDDFEKRSSTGILEYKFSIRPEMLDHLALSVSEQINNGVEVPYASKHKGWELAENRWGDVIGATRGKNDRGKEALFLDVRFKDQAAYTTGKRSNVSVGIPPKSYDGLGRVYTNPLRHLAATSAPVVPGLGDWQAIAASFDSEDFKAIIGDVEMAFPPSKNKNNGDNANADAAAAANDGASAEPDQGAQAGKTPPTAGSGSGINIFDSILQLLELSVPDGSDDKAKGTAILTALQMLKGKRAMATQQQQPGMQQGQQGAQGRQQAAPGGGVMLSQDANPMMVKLVQENRELQLSQLVREEILDSNCALELSKLFNTEEAVGVELSQGGDGTQFNQMVKILAKNKPVHKIGKGDAVELSHEAGEESPLRKATEAAVKAAK